MKLVCTTALALASLLVPCLAAADDGGDAAVDDGATPVACDGALCDTTNGASCATTPTRPNVEPIAMALAAIAIALVLWRRRRQVVTVAALIASSSEASANPPAAVDVVVKETPPPRRYVSLAWNPVALLGLGKVSFDVIVAPLEHHAIILAPYYANTSTAPIYVFDNTTGNGTQLPQQKFEGFGGELGYRYYFGLGGLRGPFIGGSFLLGIFTATAEDTTQTHYMSFGGAIDAGYQALVADHVLVAAGLGLQYTATDKTIPNQQFPANVYANGGFAPRLLLSVGWGF